MAWHTIYIGEFDDHGVDVEIRIRQDLSVPPIPKTLQIVGSSVVRTGDPGSRLISWRRVSELVMQIQDIDQDLVDLMMVAGDEDFRVEKWEDDVLTFRGNLLCSTHDFGIDEANPVIRLVAYDGMSRLADIPLSDELADQTLSILDTLYACLEELGHDLDVAASHVWTPRLSDTPNTEFHGAEHIRLRVGDWVSDIDEPTLEDLVARISEGSNAEVWQGMESNPTGSVRWIWQQRTARLGTAFDGQSVPYSVRASGGVSRVTRNNTVVASGIVRESRYRHLQPPRTITRIYEPLRHPLRNPTFDDHDPEDDVWPHWDSGQHNGIKESILMPGRWGVAANSMSSWLQQTITIPARSLWPGDRIRLSLEAEFEFYYNNASGLPAWQFSHPRCPAPAVAIVELVEPSGRVWQLNNRGGWEPATASQQAGTWPWPNPVSDCHIQMAYVDGDLHETFNSSYDYYRALIRRELLTVPMPRNVPGFPQVDDGGLIRVTIRPHDEAHVIRTPPGYPSNIDPCVGDDGEITHWQCPDLSQYKVDVLSCNVLTCDVEILDGSSRDEALTYEIDTEYRGRAQNVTITSPVGDRIDDFNLRHGTLEVYDDDLAEWGPALSWIDPGGVPMPENDLPYHVLGAIDLARQHRHVLRGVELIQDPANPQVLHYGSVVMIGSQFYTPVYIERALRHRTRKAILWPLENDTSWSPEPRLGGIKPPPDTGGPNIIGEAIQRQGMFLSEVNRREISHAAFAMAPRHYNALRGLEAVTFVDEGDWKTDGTPSDDLTDGETISGSQYYQILLDLGDHDDWWYGAAVLLDEPSVIEEVRLVKTDGGTPPNGLSCRVDILQGGVWEMDVADELIKPGYHFMTIPLTEPTLVEGVRFRFGASAPGYVDLLQVEAGSRRAASRGLSTNVTAILMAPSSMPPTLDTVDGVESLDGVVWLELTALGNLAIRRWNGTSWV